MVYTRTTTTKLTLVKSNADVRNYNDTDRIETKRYLNGSQKSMQDSHCEILFSSNVDQWAIIIHLCYSNMGQCLTIASQQTA